MIATSCVLTNCASRSLLGPHVTWGWIRHAEATSLELPEAGAKVRDSLPQIHDHNSPSSKPWSHPTRQQTHNMSSASAPQPAPSGKGQPIDPILRNALRYTISAKEYQLLHQYLLSRAPVARKRAIHPKRYDAIVKGPDDYNVAAVRASLRLGLVTFSGLKAWELITTKFLSKETPKK